jgi:hypothetical protein
VKKYLKNKNYFFAISFSTFRYAAVGLVSGRIHCTKVPKISPTFWFFFLMSAINSASYFGAKVFKSEPGYWLFCRRLFVALSSTFRQMLGWSIALTHHGSLSLHCPSPVFATFDPVYGL